MSPALQRAPEPKHAPQSSYTSYANTTSSGDGGGTESQSHGLTIQLSSDANNRSALHSIILVLPISILIFIEALRHPDKEIKLPIIDLELEINTLLPILLLVISYMLYRALRYSRIILWNIASLPSQVAELAFDSMEAYKVERPPYDEVFDRMFVEFSNLKSRFAQTLARFTFTSLNIMRTLTIYSFIFAMLLYVSLYVTKQFTTIATSIHFDLSNPQWPSDPALAVDLLVLGLSALLMVLAWTNAGITVLSASLILLLLALAITYFLVRTVFRAATRIYATRLFLPLRAIFRAAYRLSLHIRENNRDRLFVKDQQRYNDLIDQFKLSNEFDLYRQRRDLFFKIRDLSYISDKIYEFILADVKQSGIDFVTKSNWWPIINDNGFVILRIYCFDYLKVFAQYAPIDEAKTRYEELVPFADCFNPKTDAALLRELERQKELTSAERTKMGIDLRAWILSIPSKYDELRKVENEWERYLKSLDPKYSWDLASEASSYFARSELANAGFKEQEPFRGLHDWNVVTYLLSSLLRAGDPGP